MNSSFDVYVSESTCYSIDSRGFYTRKIGQGLFPTGPVDRGDYVASYVGEKINYSEYLHRSLQGLGGYLVLLRKGNGGLYLDCRSCALHGQCLASMINSPKNVVQYSDSALWSSSTFVKPKPNCKLVVGYNSIDGAYADVYATKKILPNVEFLISYSSCYVFPPVLSDEEEIKVKNSLRGFL